MKFWSNLGLVRTLKLGEFKENRSLSFRDIGVRDSRPHTEYGQYGPFQVSSTYSQRVLKLMKFWSNLGLVRTLKLGEFKENRSLSFRDIGVRDSRRHTQYGQYRPIFKLAVRILESFETNEILVKLRTGQDLESGRV